MSADRLRDELRQRFKQTATWNTTTEPTEPRRADPNRRGPLSQPVPVVINSAAAPLSEVSNGN
jgi:hypothetical protein